MHHWLQALFSSFHVCMVVGRILIVSEKVYSEVLSVCWVHESVCMCIYREGGMSMWVCVFTPWPQTGALKPLWQCAQTIFSLLSSLSISLCHSLHPRGHVLRHLHPGSVCVIFSPPTPTPDACFLHPFFCSFFSQHALDTLYTPTLSTTPFPTPSTSSAVDPSFPPGFRCV